MTAEIPGKVSIDLEAEQRLTREHRERILQLSKDAPPVTPKHGDRPTRRSQWDEAHGHWIEWDAASGEWRVIDDGPPAPAGDHPAGPPPPEPRAPVWDAAADGSLDDIE